MVKIVCSIFVGLLLVVSCAQAEQLSSLSLNLFDVIADISNHLLELINKSIEELKNIIRELNKLVKNAYDKAKKAAAKGVGKINQEYHQIMTEVTEIVKDNSILSEECQEAVHILRNDYEEFMSETNGCVDTRIQSGIKNLEKINDAADEITANLTQLREDAMECAKNIQGSTSFLQAGKCINTVAIQSAWVVGKKIPSLTLETGKLGTNILLLPPQIGYCFSTRFLSVVGGRYRETLSKVNHCLTSSTSVLPDRSEELDIFDNEYNF